MKMLTPNPQPEQLEHLPRCSALQDAHPVNIFPKPLLRQLDTHTQTGRCSPCGAYARARGRNPATLGRAASGPVCESKGLKSPEAGSAGGPKPPPTFALATPDS